MSRYFGCRAVPVPAACTILVIGALAGTARPVAAQASDARGFITINGGLQTASADFSDNIAFGHPLFGPEEGNFDTRYRTGGDTLVDVSGGVRVWRRLAVGVGVSQFSHENDAGITGRIPHPFRFDRLRQISGTETGLTRQEMAVHIQALWVIPAGRAVEIALFGGPTFFNVTQDLVTGVTFDQTYPYNDATFAGASQQPQSASTIGFHAGADGAVYFSNWVGVGGMVRFSRGSVDLDSQGGGVAIDTGGVQTSGGLRLRF